MRKFLRNNGLVITCFTLFFLFLFAQAVTGYRANNAELVSHGEPKECFSCYMTSGEFYEATFENWESEFLQMGAFVVLTVFLFQKGSSESKKLRGDPRDEDPREHSKDPHAPWPAKQGGIWLRLYENSLLIAFFILFALSFIGHLIGGARAYSSEQIQHGQPGVTVWEYLRTSQFWFESFQNWQSEFLAVASISILAVFLRQRGSAESKPVFVPHAKTGDE